MNIDNQEPTENQELNELNEGCGVISIHRINGSIKLFATPFERHEAGIEIRIHGAAGYNSSGRTKYHPDRGRPLLKIWMSNLQFSEAITNLGRGDGVPCTIKNIGRESMPEPPIRNEVADFHLEAKAAIAESLSGVRASIAVIRNSSSMSKKEKEAAISCLRAAIQSLEGSLPFIAEIFREFMVESIHHAKAEVAAYCEQMEIERGRYALAAGRELPQLEAGGFDGTPT